VTLYTPAPPDANTKLGQLYREAESCGYTIVNTRERDGGPAPWEVRVGHRKRFASDEHKWRRWNLYRDGQPAPVILHGTIAEIRTYLEGV
jgi:hypothetical protein